MARESNNPAAPAVPFKWTKPKEAAAELLANDELADSAIAAEVGIGLTTLYDWKRRPEFRARVNESAAEIREEIRARGIAVRENRIRAQQDRWRRFNRIVAARAADPEMQAVPGGDTGWLVHNVKMIGAGPDAEKVDLYEFDAALAKATADIEKQAAQELGQWTEKRDVTTDGKPISSGFDLSALSDDELRQVRDLRQKMTGAGPLPDH